MNSVSDVRVVNFVVPVAKVDGASVSPLDKTASPAESASPFEAALGDAIRKDDADDEADARDADESATKAPDVAQASPAPVPVSAPLSIVACSQEQMPTLSPPPARAESAEPKSSVVPMGSSTCSESNSDAKGVDNANAASLGGQVVASSPQDVRRSGKLTNRPGPAAQTHVAQGPMASTFAEPKPSPKGPSLNGSLSNEQPLRVPNAVHAVLKSSHSVPRSRLDLHDGRLADVGTDPLPCQPPLTTSPFRKATQGVESFAENAAKSPPSPAIVPATPIQTLFVNVGSPATVTSELQITASHTQDESPANETELSDGAANSISAMLLRAGNAEVSAQNSQFDSQQQSAIPSDGAQPIARPHSDPMMRVTEPAFETARAAHVIGSPTSVNDQSQVPSVTKKSGSPEIGPLAGKNQRAKTGSIGSERHAVAPRLMERAVLADLTKSPIVAGTAASTNASRNIPNAASLGYASGSHDSLGLAERSLMRESAPDVERGVVAEEADVSNAWSPVSMDAQLPTAVAPPPVPIQRFSSHSSGRSRESDTLERGESNKDSRVELATSAVNRMALRQEVSAEVEVPELGRIHVGARTHQQEVDIRVTAARGDAAAAIQAHSPLLVADMRTANIPLGRMTLDGPGSGTFAAFGERQGSGRDSNQPGQRREGDHSMAQDTSMPVRRTRVRIVL